MKRALKDPAVVAIVLIGVVVSVGIALAIQEQNRSSAEQWLDERAELIAAATEATVDRAFADLNAIAAFLDNSDTMTQDRFSSFVGQTNVNPGVIGIGYLQVVEQAAVEEFQAEAQADVPGFKIQSFDGNGGIAPDYTPRPFFYPIRYVEGGPFLDIVIARTPIETQEDALGFDVATEPLWLPAFEHALAIPTPSVSDLVAVGGEFEEQAFSVAHPILDDQQRPKGVLVAPGLDTLLTSDLGISITANVVWEVGNELPDGVESGWPVWQKEIELVGSTWTLSVEPTQEAMADLAPHTHVLLLVVGLSLTALVATTTWQLRVRSRQNSEMSQLQKVAADKDRFLATVSHELRTPLTVVVGLSHELADNSHNFDEAEKTDLLSMISGHSEEAAAIVEDLLVAARSDIDKLTIRAEAIDLAKSAHLALNASPLEKAAYVGEPSTAFADPQRVRQILRNLFTNASRYGGPNVEVRFGVADGRSVVAVADDGPPISEAHRQQIFDPYTSAHEDGEHLGSIGLGLFISLKLARLMGGDLVYKHDGTHSLFELHLPQTDRVVTADS